MSEAMDKFNFLLRILFCIIMSLGFVEAAPKSSLITYLPGFSGTFPSEHYSGYVSFDQKNLFYYFVVSERNPLKDPVVLWLNGGPGCSSLDGFVYEHGPFNFQEGSLPILHLNPYSWSKVANIIYLDSPCGVGFSYSKNKTKYITGDLQTSSDTHTFLLKWFELYPEFRKNPFYISGESYAGIYVPTLAYEVVKGIKAGVQPKINFKGYSVGNGVADSYYDSTLIALIPFAHGMGLISDDINDEIQVTCSGDLMRPCLSSLKKAAQSLGELNFYDILEPCYHRPTQIQETKGNKSLPESFKKLGATERPLKVRKRMFGRAWPLWGQFKYGILWPQLAQHGSVMCFNDEIATAWLNDESVRRAIHAQPNSIAGPWELCTDRLNYSRFGAGSMLPYHKNLTAQGYRALIYSGDHDMCVPFTGTQAWVRSLGYNIVDPWRPWLSNHQIAGYLQGYANNLIFLTVKGAGHTVPEYKPREALDFYSRWLEGKRI